MLRSQTPLLGLQTRKNVLVETRGPDPSSWLFASESRRELQRRTVSQKCIFPYKLLELEFPRGSRSNGINTVQV